MKIILRKDHEFLGNAGELLEVKTGYARNFLIPNGYATLASPSNIKQYEDTRKQQSKKIDKEREEAKKIAAQIEATSLTIQVKAGEEDKVFGSVTSQMIYDALAEKGFTTIDKRKILLKDPIKALGDHTVNIKLFSEVTAALKVTVEKEGTVHAEETAPETTEEPAAEETVNEEAATEETPAENA